MAKVKLSEAALRQIINESVAEYLNEGCADESWAGISKGFQTAKNIMGNRGNGNFFQRAKQGIQNGYQNYKTESNIETLRTVQQALKAALDAGQIQPQQTVQQIMGVAGRSLSSQIGRMRAGQTRLGATPVGRREEE